MEWTAGTEGTPDLPHFPSGKCYLLGHVWLITRIKTKSFTVVQKSHWNETQLHPLTSGEKAKEQWCDMNYWNAPRHEVRLCKNSGFNTGQIVLAWHLKKWDLDHVILCQPNAFPFFLPFLNPSQEYLTQGAVQQGDTAGFFSWGFWCCLFLCFVLFWFGLSWVFFSLVWHSLNIPWRSAPRKVAHISPSSGEKHGESNHQTTLIHTGLIYTLDINSSFSQRWDIHCYKICKVPGAEAAALFARLGSNQLCWCSLYIEYLYFCLIYLTCLLLRCAEWLGQPMPGDSFLF